MSVQQCFEEYEALGLKFYWSPAWWKFQRLRRGFPERIRQEYARELVQFWITAVDENKSPDNDEAHTSSDDGDDDDVDLEELVRATEQHMQRGWMQAHSNNEAHSNDEKSGSHCFHFSDKGSQT
jgi:hypothetical protein